jgi:hypothetical protein
MLKKIKFFLGMVLALCCFMALIMKADVGLMVFAVSCAPYLEYMAARVLLDLVILVATFVSLWLMNFFKVNL